MFTGNKLDALNRMLDDLLYDSTSYALNQQCMSPLYQAGRTPISTRDYTA